MSRQLHDPIEPNHPLDEDKRKNDANFFGKPKEMPPLYDETLVEILGFTSAELNANRMGRLTDSQQERVNHDLKEEMDAMWLLLTIMLGTMVVIGLILTSGSLPTIYLVIAGGIVVGGLLLVAYLRQQKLRQDAESTRVKQVAGVPQLVVGGFLNRRDVKLSIGDKVLSITLDQFMQFARYDLPYMKVYYTQNKLTVLSAEVLHRYNDDLTFKNILSEQDIMDIPDHAVVDDTANTKQTQG